MLFFVGVEGEIVSLYRKDTGVVTECLGSSLSLEQAQGVLRTTVICRGLQDSYMHFFHVMSVYIFACFSCFSSFLSPVSLFRVFVPSPSLVFLYFFLMSCLPLAHSHPVYRVRNVHLSLLCVCASSGGPFLHLFVRTH